MNNAEMVMYLNNPETFMFDRVAILDAHVAAAVAQALQPNERSEALRRDKDCREARREALEEAARAVCGFCLDVSERRTYWSAAYEKYEEYWHRDLDNGQDHACAASPIHALLAGEGESVGGERWTRKNRTTQEADYTGSQSTGPTPTARPSGMRGRGRWMSA